MLIENMEKWLVGSIMSDTKLASQIRELSPFAFNRSDLRLIFTAILAVRDRGDEPNIANVAIWLNDRDELEEVGGPLALKILADEAPYVMHVGEWCDAIRKSHERRLLTVNSNEIARLSSDPTVSNDELKSLIASCVSSTSLVDDDRDYIRLDHQERPAPLPEFVFDAPGVIGEMVRYNIDCAPRVQKELALFGSLALVATVCGQKIRTESDIRPNIYVLAIAESGHGKDFPRKANSRALTEAGLAKYLAPEKPRSDKSLIHVLARQGSCLMQVDEMAHWLSSINAENASQWSRGLSSCLKELYSQSDRAHVAPFTTGDGKDDQILVYPHLNVYGSCQPLIWNSITLESVVDGLMARMLIVQSTTDLPKLRMVNVRDVGEPTISILQAWDSFVPGTGNLASVMPNAMPVYFDSQAEIRLRSHSEKIEDKLRKDEAEIRVVWMRASAMARKLAMIFAASRGPESLVVTVDDAERAIACVNWSTRTLVYSIRAHVGGSQMENMTKAMIGVMRKKKRATVRSLFNAKAIRVMSVRDRHMILHGLHEVGSIEISGDLSQIGRYSNIVTYVHE
jgi:hypothetical protein